MFTANNLVFIKNTNVLVSHSSSMFSHSIPREISKKIKNKLIKNGGHKIVILTRKIKFLASKLNFHRDSQKINVLLKKLR